MKDPYQVVLKRYVTEKATMLQDLQNRASNKSLARFKSPKYVFLVDGNATKPEIAAAIEEIYSEQKVKVKRVNTIIIKGKVKRRGRFRPGVSAPKKKAIVTLESGDSIEKIS